jgi:hypothetical protein
MEAPGFGRTFSAEDMGDLVSGIWRIGQAGMGRTDSEAAFQEFLKRIPSATNLAAANNASQQLEQQQQLQAQAQQLLASSAAALGSAPIPSAPPLALEAGAPLPGMPRVPSLDLLKQYVQLANNVSVPPVKHETHGVPARSAAPAPSSSGGTSADVPPPAGRNGPLYPPPAPLAAAVNGPSPSSAANDRMLASVLQAALPAAGGVLPGAFNPAAAAAAAAALQMGSFSQPRGGGDKEVDKAEVRRQRRWVGQAWLRRCRHKQAHDRWHSSNVAARRLAAGHTMCAAQLHDPSDLTSSVGAAAAIHAVD